MKYISSIILLASIIPFPVLAQYDQDIAVEGKYVPEYINHDRIGIFPKPVRFPLEKSNLQYSLEGVNADFLPKAVPIQATGWNINHDYSNRRGYVEFGIGSWLQTTLSAGYHFIDDRKTTVGIRLQHNSTSLWKPGISRVVDARMERYDESIGIYGNHSFGNAGRLDAAFDYHIGNFNYYGFNPYIIHERSVLNGNKFTLDAPTQTLNDISGRLSWHSPADNDKLSWNVGAGVRYFGYRRFYEPTVMEYVPALTGGRETHVNFNGGVSVYTSTKSSLGIDVNADILSYGKPEWRSAPEGVTEPTSLDSYGMVSLTPYYRFTRDRLNIMLGARVDLTFNAGPKNERYDLFHIAPEVRLDYNAGPVTFFFHALGGSELHTLAGGYELDYYQAPMLSVTNPIYTPLDAKLGVAFGPFSGFHAGFDIAFRASRGQYYGGFYQCWINGTEPENQLDLPVVAEGREVYYNLSPGSKYNIAGFSFGLNVGYDAGRYFRIDGDIHYQHQNGSTGYFNGYDRPEFTGNLCVETNPWKTLKFRVGYGLRALRMMPVEAHYADTNPFNSNLKVMYKLPNMSMLNLGASYGIKDNLNVWLQADNLLNRTNYYMPGLPEPGVRISAGIGIGF